MAKVERNGSPKGQSISLAFDGDGVELVHGSMKALGIQHGDLVIVRLAGDRYHEQQTHRRVLELVEEMLVSTGRKAVALVVPADFDLELLPRSIAAQLLEELVAKTEGA